jgi:hypothetical protein
MRIALAGEPLSISLEAIDEFGIDSVTLYYRTIVINNTFAPVSLIRSGGTQQAGIWYGTIPGINVTLQGVEYYLWATDKGGNSRYYGNASVPFVITVQEAVPEIPLYVSVIAIVILSYAALALFFALPKYEGEDTK